MGQGGLHTDDSPSAIPPTDLIKANNVSMSQNLIEKTAGAVSLNTSAIPGGVFAAFDFWPTAVASDRRLVILGGDGKTYQMTTGGVVTEITPSGGAPTALVPTNQALLVAGGAEDASQPRKLFLFTQGSLLQKIFISAGALTRTNISAPATDWSSAANQPTWGLIDHGRLFAGGNANAPHRIYASSATDHEDFTGSDLLTFNVFPGEGERLLGSGIFKSRQIVAKYPVGFYYLVDNDADSTTWYYAKTTAAFGFASTHSYVDVLNDALVKNASDSVNSLEATLNFGDVAVGDVLLGQKIEQFIRENTNPDGARATHAIYYPEKKTVYMTYRSTGGLSNDRLLSIRTDINTKSKISFLTAFAPNCLALYKDSHLVQRPIYGSLDGFVYIMDQPNRSVNGIGYNGEFQTPYLDFGFLNLPNVPNLTSKNKNFDFLELRYVPEGDWSVFADIYIDGNYSETLEFPMLGSALLGDKTAPVASDFQLGDKTDPATGDYLADTNLITIRKRLRGTGRTISVRVYNSGNNQTFRIATMIFSFRVSGEQQR